MSKFCGNCGAQVEDDARVCGNCGAVLSKDMAMPEMNMDQGGNTQVNRKNNVRLIIMIAAIAAAAVIVILLAVRIVGDNTGYKGTLKKYFKGIQNCDATSILSCLSNGDLEYFESSYGNDYEDTASDDMDDMKDSFDDKFGSDYKVTYKIKSSRKMSKHDFEDFRDNLEDYYNFDTDGISQAMNVRVRYKIKGSDGSDSDTVSMVMVKDNGKWKIIARGYSILIPFGY